MWGMDVARNPKLAPPPGFRVIALDCRGHGQSDKPHDRGLYGTEMAMDVIRLMDHLKIPKAHLVGYSMGAFIVGKIAAAQPSRVISAVYGGQVPLVFGAPPSGSRETAVFAKAVEEGKGMGPYILEVIPPGRAKLTLEQANVLAEFMLKGKDAKALAAAGLSFDDLQVEEKNLVACPAPALFIYGSLESEHLKGRVEAVRQVLPKAEVVVIEGGDHITTLARPAFGAAIREFLPRVRGGDPGVPAEEQVLIRGPGGMRPGDGSVRRGIRSLGVAPTSKQGWASNTRIVEPPKSTESLPSQSIWSPGGAGKSVAGRLKESRIPNLPM